MSHAPGRHPSALASLLLRCSLVQRQQSLRPTSVQVVPRCNQLQDTAFVAWQQVVFRSDLGQECHPALELRSGFCLQVPLVLQASDDCSQVVLGAVRLQFDLQLEVGLFPTSNDQVHIVQAELGHRPFITTHQACSPRLFQREERK